MMMVLEVAGAWNPMDMDGCTRGVSDESASCMCCPSVEHQHHDQRRSPPAVHRVIMMMSVRVPIHQRLDRRQKANPKWKASIVLVGDDGLR